MKGLVASSTTETLERTLLPAFLSPCPALFVMGSTGVQHSVNRPLAAAVPLMVFESWAIIVAQLVEHQIVNLSVTGSTPVVRTKLAGNQPFPSAKAFTIAGGQHLFFESADL